MIRYVSVRFNFMIRYTRLGGFGVGWVAVLETLPQVLTQQEKFQTIVSKFTNLKKKAMVCLFNGTRLSV